MPRLASSRASLASSATRPSTAQPSTLIPQSQAAPLSTDAVAKINELKNASQKALNDRIAAALVHIMDATDLINNRGYEERVKFNNRKRKAGEDNEATPSQDQQDYDQLQEKVQLTTKQLDLGVRQIIDDRAWLENIPEAIDHVTTKSLTASNRINRPTQATHEDEDDENEEDTPVVQPEPSENPTALLHAALSTHTTTWNSKSLTARYASDNDYKGYKRLVWESNHQGDNAPPMPHANIWFAAGEGRANNNHSSTQPNNVHPTVDPTSTQGTILDLQSPTPSSPASSDIEIQSERTRITCPLTLQPFTDPLTSSKCPHSFERKAITEMLRESKVYLPLTPTQNAQLASSGTQQARAKLEREFRKPMVQCPECVMQLTSNDLRPDPALLRKVKRILERQRREEEEDANRDDEGDGGVHDLDEEDEDDLPRLSQRRKKTVVNLGSSPDRSMRGSARKVPVKDERVRDSVVPQTQFDDDEEEDEDEEMYD